jgi:hypothetical protein
VLVPRSIFGLFFAHISLALVSFGDWYYLAFTLHLFILLRVACFSQISFCSQRWLD